MKIIKRKQLQPTTTATTTTTPRNNKKRLYITSQEHGQWTISNEYYTYITRRLSHWEMTLCTQ